MNNVEEYLNKIDFSPYGDVKITAFELRQIMTGFEKHLASNTEIVGNVSERKIVRCEDPMVCLRGCSVHEQTCKHPIYER